jgi:hypothetical protein
MGKLAVVALRVVLALVLAGSLFVQVVMVPLLSADLSESEAAVAAVRIPLLVIVLLGIVAAQVALVCVWRLLSMVRRGTVFSSGAFRYVDIIMGAVAAASLLVFGFGATLAPGEAVAPGVVLLIGGAGLLIACVALIVLVLRVLLAQAVARDAEASNLQHELDEVI